MTDFYDLHLNFLFINIHYKNDFSTLKKEIDDIYGFSDIVAQFYGTAQG